MAQKKETKKDKDKNLIDFFTDNLGWVVLVIILVIILAPSFVSGRQYGWYQDCFLFRNTDFMATGQIGDTIGGITAPFIGLLSIILLFITFREQRKFNEEQLSFNRTQQSASDLNLLFDMQKRIESLAGDIQFTMIFPGNSALKEQYTGLENIDKLNNNGYGSKSRVLDSDDFEQLYDKISIITSLCIIFFKINHESAIAEDIKKSFFYAVWTYSKNVGLFYTFCQEKKISFMYDYDMNQIGDDPLGLKEERTIDYINQLNDVLKYKIE